MKRSSKKGFTLAELLIVIAIIAILIAVMFPVFGAQLDKARAAAELANVRAAYSELVANQMLGDATPDGSGNITINPSSWNTITVKASDLKKACQFSETEVKAEGGTITVTYKKYVGSFKVDTDVTLTNDTTTTNP